jgi:signal transduction histidine kinase
VLAISLVGGLGIQLIAADGLFPYAALFALGSLAAARPPRVSLPALLAVLALAATNFFTAPVEDTLFAIVVVLAAWAFGEVVRNRRAAIEEAMRGAATEEQARIARELHDVIAHSVSVIVVQAAAAGEVFDSQPEQARTALRSIETAGRDALRELRLLLAAVRPGADADPTHPQPGLDRLDELAEPLRAAGLEVAVRREGLTRTVPAGVDLSAYRIVQEALTNTLRHAHATRAQVTVRLGSELLELDVLDDGRGASGEHGDGSGRGLAGMRERASMLGGTLEAGPAQRGGYRIHARLPLEAVE